MYTCVFFHVVVVSPLGLPLRPHFPLDFFDMFPPFPFEAYRQQMKQFSEQRQTLGQIAQTSATNKAHTLTTYAHRLNRCHVHMCVVFLMLFGC